MSRKQRAIELYEVGGYTCAQAVAMAYGEVLGISEEDGARMFAGFGGGFGGQHEVCGAISAMTAVMSKLVSEGTPDMEDKKRVYSRIQNACKDFKKQHESIICRTLLVNAKKTDQRAKPCGKYIGTVCDLIEQSIGKNSRFSEK